MEKRHSVEKVERQESCNPKWQRITVPAEWNANEMPWEDIRKKCLTANRFNQNSQKLAVAISNVTFGILDLILTITMLAKVQTNGTKEASWKAKVNQAKSTYPGLEQTPACACLLSLTHFGSESQKTSKQWCLGLVFGTSSLVGLAAECLIRPKSLSQVSKDLISPTFSVGGDSLDRTCLKTSAGSKKMVVGNTYIMKNQPTKYRKTCHDSWHYWNHKETLSSPFEAICINLQYSFCLFCTRFLTLWTFSQLRNLGPGKFGQSYLWKFLLLIILSIAPISKPGQMPTKFTHIFGESFQVLIMNHEFW